MDKAAFLQVTRAIVEGFEAADFKAAMAAAQQRGDVGQLVALPMAVQERAFAVVGLDAAGGTAEFKAAGRQFGLDADVAPLLARMKAALA